MKRFIIGVVAAMAMVPLAMAQEQDTENLDVWKRNKGITLSYITNQSLKEVDSPIDYQYDSSVGFSFTSGTSYLWPRNAGWFGNRLKVGVDARWLDVSYVKYKKYPKVGGVQLGPEDFYEDYDYDYDYDYGDEEMSDFGSHQLNLGVGIGPTVAFVPFSSSNSALRFLRLNVFGHFNPAASLMILNGESDSELSFAFMAAYDFGMNFQWKNFTLGFEGRWGKAKFNTFMDGDEDWDDMDYGYDDDYDSEYSEKRTFKNASFRVSLGFRF